MAKLQARIQDFEMGAGGGVNFCNNVIEPKPGWGVWGLCINMIEEGLRKKGGVKIHPFHLPGFAPELLV